MATHCINDLTKLNNDEQIIRLAYGKADESKGQKVHFSKKGKKSPTYTLLLAMFELRPCDEDHLSIHRKRIKGWDKCINTMYAELKVDSVHAINVLSEEIDISSLDISSLDLSSLQTTNSYSYSCIVTDYGKSENDLSHGGIFFYDTNSLQTVSYNFIENEHQVYDDLEDYPFTKLSQQLLNAVTGFYNSKHEPKKFCI
jgi:hypothetical protein